MDFLTPSGGSWWPRSLNAQERVGGLLPPLRLLQPLAHRQVNADLGIQLSMVHPAAVKQ